MMAKGRKVLMTGEVAEICNVASRTVEKWFDKKLLRGYRIPGSRDRRIPIPELVRFMKKYEIPGHGHLQKDWGMAWPRCGMASLCSRDGYRGKA